MKNVHCMTCVLCVPVWITASVVLADPPTESLAGIWFADHDDPEAGYVIRLGEYPPVPPDVQADLEAFNQSLASAPMHLRDGWIDVSGDGKTFGLGSITRADEPTGVWIWPNWRNATPVIFDQYNYFSFVGNRHVVLYPGAVIADLEDPQTLHELPGVWGPMTYRFHVTDDGRWAGTTDRGRQLVLGQLDPEHPNAGAAHAQAIELPETGEIRFLTWIRGGECLVVELMPDDREEGVVDIFPKSMLFVIRADDMSVVDTAEFGWLFAGGFTAADQSFFGGINDARQFVTVSPAGQLSSTDTGFPEEEDGDERPANISPSGKFVFTHWDKGEILEDEDGVQTLVEELQSEIRHTPLADPEQPLPTWPTHEVDGEEVVGSMYFWLSWE